jgi:hypothetical protein
MPLYDRDKYISSLGPKFFQYERSIRYLRGLAQKVKPNCPTVIVVAMVRTDSQRMEKAGTFAEHIVTSSIDSYGKARYRVREYDIEGARLQLWGSTIRGRSITRGDIAIYGYWFPPFDAMLEKELVDFILACE